MATYKNYDIIWEFNSSKKYFYNKILLVIFS